ncbi:sodium:solute symporter [Oceanihabitans sediminis]|uniref:Sodium:solute symporter n=1 Tax=Oceanihabitans sediminis TaxID=1812012 RepID=A0A368P5J5_9FLAO|nr:sodium:solute symporter [Oceanihabitans sediminis]MDX1278840.1 sodium:solute symporter [Oceanihabitans sediminis]MDX1773303.1 sodium:solute symporter [Oceanihabitans sediminis]RBP32734.1 SSS family transporter [Oceanihabitans sediminis]RCU57726.1 sodium:solute symporter [Oceanihabitans sediminis]
MQTIDWIVLIGTLLLIVVYGTWQTRGSKNVQDYLKGGNTSKWWTIGLSVMATQASAITFLSTPGQAFNDGMGFVQFYFGLPLAMVIICMVFIPLYHRLKVYTAYEFLENRFDLKTRTLTAILFLIQRGLAAGITIFAPAIILSAVLGWNLLFLNIIIGVLVIIYTVSGGTRAVNVTQKHQMVVIFTGMIIAFILIINKLPADITFSKALDIAGASGKMEVLDFSFNLNNRYTFWSGVIGGTFLMLSYFGTDQSQVQRYLSGKSLREMQLGLIFNGILKVPMQFFILLVGVMVFVFYQFNPAPVNFNPTASELVLNSDYAEEYKQLQVEQEKIFNDKQTIINAYNKSESKEYAKLIHLANEASDELRTEARLLIDKAADAKQLKVESNDKDYVFIHFILNNLPRGLIGLLLAVILSAAMSSTASELNALASTTTIDLYKRNTPEKSETEMVKASKWFTLAWGIIAIAVACIANLAENLIQLVNIIGSIFYGNVLGIFLLAFFFKTVKGNAVFIAALITQVIIIGLFLLNQYELINLPFLWLNFVGCLVVITLALIISFKDLRKNSRLALVSIAAVLGVFGYIVMQ